MIEFTVTVDCRGDVALLYSKTMECEFSCRPKELRLHLQKLLNEWIALREAEGEFPIEQSDDIGPYTLLIGGRSVEEAHSTECFQSKQERFTAWMKHTSREYAWLPMPDGKYCANTEENINALLSLLRKR